MRYIHCESPEFEHPYELGKDLYRTMTTSDVIDFEFNGQEVGFNVHDDNEYKLYFTGEVTPLHRLDENVSVVREDGQWNLDDYSTAIKKNANYFAFPVLDLRNCSGIKPNVEIIRERLMPDGLHPNDEGYRRLFEVIDGFIKSI